jgi:hypothetical protein
MNGMNDMAGKAVRATVERIGKMPRYNNTARVRESEDTNRTRVAGHRDEVEGVVANTLNGASGKRCDIDGKAEGRENGSERVNLFRDGAVGFIDWLDLLSQHNDISCGLRVLKRHEMLPISRSRDLVELSPARQFECAVACDISANGDEFFACRAECPPDDYTLRDWPTMSIDDATGVGVRRSRLATSNRYGRCQTCRERLELHNA